MAYFTDPNKEQDEEQEGGMNAPIATSTQTGSITPGTPGNIATQQVNAPKAASSGMTGFNQFAKANQGTAQNRLNSATTQNVQNSGQQANNAISQATASFGQKVDAGSLKDRQNAVSDVANITNAARNVSAPVAPQPQVSGGAIPQAGAPQATLPAPGVDQNQQNRFQEVINSKYQGPESLRQSGLYQVASGKVQGAQNALNQTKTAGGREDLLKSMNAQRGDYSTGLNKLDAALLNSNKQGVSQLQAAAQAQGNVEQKLDQAQISSANLAQNRGNEIRGIQEQARNEFTQGQTAERAATDQRLSQVVADWDKLPEHFREALRNQEKGTVGLGAQEAAMLGIQTGEGLYNEGAGVIKTNLADKNKLISRDEQTRQSVLAQLAGLDQQKRLDTNMVYDKADMAGTQTAMDALDVTGTRAGINEAEQKFRDYAESSNLTGYGQKKNKSSGKRYYAEESANLKDVLSRSGYNFNADQGQAAAGNSDIVNGIRSKRVTDSDEQNGLGGAQEAFVGQYTNLGDGQSLVASGLNASMPYMSLITGALGMGDFGGAVSGVFGGGANTKASKNIASAQAQADLRNKVQGAIDTSGFQNRFAVQDNEATQGRQAALQQLLANIDKNKG